MIPVLAQEGSQALYSVAALFGGIIVLAALSATFAPIVFRTLLPPLGKPE